MIQATTRECQGSLSPTLIAVMNGLMLVAERRALYVCMYEEEAKAHQRSRERALRTLDRIPFLTFGNAHRRSKSSLVHTTCSSHTFGRSGDISPN